MDAGELTAFRKMIGLSQERMAKDVLGYGLRAYQSMEAGDTLIRKGVDLSCAAYAMGIREYNGPTIQAMWKRRQKRRGR